MDEVRDDVAAHVVVRRRQLAIGLDRLDKASLAAQRRTAENLSAMEAALNAFHESIRLDSDAVPPDCGSYRTVAPLVTGNSRSRRVARS